MRSLDLLVLGSNTFTGSLPLSLSNLRYLHVLVLSNNSLSGSINNALPPSLFLLDLTDNQFTGAIPGTISRLGNGVTRSSARLSNNNFSSFDDEWYRGRDPMLRLSWFYAANNSFKGRFPPVLEGALLLLELDLSNNDLSGPLPSEANDFWSLLLLNLSSNAFTGPIPDSWKRSRLFNIDNDAKVDLSFNQLSGPIPDFFYKILMNGAVNKTIDLEGNDFDVECPLTKSLSFIHGLVCIPNHSAPPITEASLTANESFKTESSFDTPAESSIEGPEALYTTSVIDDTVSTVSNTSTTDADGEEEIESSTSSSSNTETTGVVEAQSLEEDSTKSSRNALWISVFVIAGFALLLAVFFVVRRVSNSRKTITSEGAAGGGRKPANLTSLPHYKAQKSYHLNVSPPEVMVSTC